MSSSDYFSKNLPLSNSFKRQKISPSEDIFGEIQSKTVKSSQKEKNKKKYARNSCRHKKCIALSRQSAREVNELKNLVNSFLCHKFSAAGVSYIARSRSPFRKILWLATVVASVSFMGYMTYNVVQEYMKFPKMLIREENTTVKLPFPAVTLCSLNPLIDITNNKTSVYRLMQLKQMLEEAETVPSDTRRKDRCFQHPLCQWSWFNESCVCVEHPCSTEFCVAENTTHCICSGSICKEFSHLQSCNGGANPEDCCVCPVDLKEKVDGLNLHNYRQFVTDKGKNAKVNDVMNLIRTAETNDLVDIEEEIMPQVSDLLKYGIKYDNLVISCSFEGARCFRENFTVLYHATYGRCYMFNYLGMKESTEQPVIAYNYGSSSGLRLILHVRKQNSIDFLNSEIGARIIIHDPYDLPFVEEDGINVRPHDMSAIEVKQSMIKRLEPPYGYCVRDGSHLHFHQPSAGQPYSILGCQKACRNYHLRKKCGCTRRSYVMGSVFYMKMTEVKFCRLQNKIEHNCMTEVIGRIEQGNISCDCRPPCVEKIYSTTVSSSDISETYFKAVKKVRTFHSKDGKFMKINATEESNLMVGIKVYYSTFQVDIDTEQASYSWETLIANIGGNLGFFMGLTLVTVMEVLEFLWDFVVTSVRQYSHFARRSSSEKRLQMFPNN